MSDHVSCLLLNAFFPGEHSVQGCKTPCLQLTPRPQGAQPIILSHQAVPHRYPQQRLTLDIQDHRDLDGLVPHQLAREGDTIVGLSGRGDADVADVHFVPIFQIHLAIFSVPEQLLGLAAVLYQAGEGDGSPR